MTRLTVLKLAASTLIATIGLGAPSVAVMANGGDQIAARPDRAVRSAERANRMLDRNRVAEAVRFAEEAVAYDPETADYRALLGQAYLAAGRYDSAMQSFADARQLGSSDSRTLIGHALTLIAADRGAEAVALVDANMAAIPASDYGLALSLAGQAERGTMVLIDVVRAPGATARDRQNLALSFALAGRWLEAQLIATQDVGAANVSARMAQWSALAQSSDMRQRVAGLLGTAVQDDPGLPVELALYGSEPNSPALASTLDPAPLAMYAPRLASADMADVDGVPADQAGQMGLADVATAAVAPTDTSADPAPLTDLTPVADVAAAAPAGLVSPLEAVDVAMQFVSSPVIQQLRAAVAMVAPVAPIAAAAPVAAVTPAAQIAPVAAAPARNRSRVAAAAPTTAAARRIVATGPVRTTGWAVQLGAYESVGVARDGWANLSRRHAMLGARDAISTSATVDGRTFFRLNATGFDTRAAAVAACASVTRAGGNCFVRQLDGRDAVRWVSRSTGQRLAAR